MFFIFNSSRNSNQICDVNPRLDSVVISANDVEFTAEIAKTGEEKARGLSDRNCINDTHAMIFPYALTGDYCFWMKDMNFAIDMVWLDDDKKLVNSSTNVSPDSYPEKFCPEKPAKYIIEFSAGTVENYNWQTGTEFKFTL